MTPKHTNELINESSPYLLQHAHNPVNWHAWSDGSWEKARKEDKPVIVSVGYSACHWCHVMEHESFEDETVARLMNEHFISIKVDREERPDVDQIYMDACQMITGRGGWPLNAVTLPDGRPIYAGTYFPRENWKQLLLYFADYWKNHREEAMERATDITNGIRSMDVIKKSENTSGFSTADRDAVFKKIDSTWDYLKGGRMGSPKFPMPVNMRYLLQHYYYTQNEKALHAVTLTLDNMMDGGIYDQVGGGFARYSVDADWEIPHFEKMLYDNAQLVSLYSDAYRVTKKARYKEVVYETLEFIERELAEKSGGFQSALDADSEGHEGKFYVWSTEELQRLLGNDYADFCNVFNVSAKGNFEGLNHLTRKADIDIDHPQRIVAWKRLLLETRVRRIWPGLDDKVLCSWNALMILGYIDAYKAFGDKAHLDTALEAADFIKDKMLQSGFKLMRNYKNGKVSINGFLDDYSFTAEAFLAVYQSTFNARWLQLANELAEHVIQHFYNANTGFFFYTSINDTPLIARKTETSDNVIPSSNSSIMKTLFQLGLILDKPEYINMAKRATAQLRDYILGHPSYYAQWAALVDWVLNEPYQVAICGENALTLTTDFNKRYSPDCVLMGATGASSIPLLKDKYVAGKTLLYVCKDKSCGLPVENVADALTQLT